MSFHTTCFIIITSLPFYPSCHPPYLFFNVLSVVIHLEFKLVEIRSVLLLYYYITSINCLVHCSSQLFKEVQIKYETLLGEITKVITCRKCAKMLFLLH